MHRWAASKVPKRSPSTISSGRDGCVTDSSGRVVFAVYISFRTCPANASTGPTLPSLGHLAKASPVNELNSETYWSSGGGPTGVRLIDCPQSSNFETTSRRPTSNSCRSRRYP